MADVNWNEVFENYKTVKFESISQYVDEEKPEYRETLEASIEEGKSYPNIKKEFYEKYFKQYIPIPKPKSIMREWVKKNKNS